MLNNKGFSLIEMLVVVGIVAVVGVMSVTAIIYLQRSGRDAQRLKVLQDIKSEITRLQSQTGRVPKEDNFSWGESEIIISLSGTNPRIVETPGITSSKGGSDNVCSATIESDSNGTVYCFKIEPDGYILGADKENGVLDIGTSRKTFADLKSSK